MKAAGLALLLPALLLTRPAAALAAPVHYQPPAETTTLAPGPDRDLAAGVCATCHSLDYVTTQPRSLPDMHAFWAAEVAKMRGPYGAPIDDAQAKKIVDYLATTYGK
jgi:mono/diheme cytochrome c family protein